LFWLQRIQVYEGKMSTDHASPDQLECEIQNVLGSLCESLQASRWGRPEWREEVISAVGAAADRAGYRWLSHSSRSEWLWDGVAQEWQGHSLIGVPLTLEVEWHGWAEIKYDFEKLLVSRAEHRVMVCSAGSRAGAERNISRLRAMIDAFRLNRSGDRYFLACWHGRADAAGEFVFELIVV
jgi:hypothetical protein